MRLLPLCLALLALPAFAEGPPNLSPPNLSPATGRPGTVARLIEAHRLYHLGQSAHDPLLILAAARLMQGVTLREVTRTIAEPLPKDQDPDKTAKAKTDAAQARSPGDVPSPPPDARVVPDPAQSAPLPGALDPKAMMAEARDMLTPKDLLGDVIARAEAETPPPGPVAMVTSLVQGPAGTTTFGVPLAGDSYGEIGLLQLSANSTEAAVSDPATVGHLTLTVTDAAGNLVCRDASATSTALCGIVPKETGTFRVTITNDGTAPAAYLLITN